MFHALVFLPVILSIFGFLIPGHSGSSKVSSNPEGEEEASPSPEVGVDNMDYVPDNQN